MIAVMINSKEGKEISFQLKRRGHQVLAVVWNDYGRQLAEGSGADFICFWGGRSGGELGEALTAKGVRTVVDASRLFTDEELSERVRELCRKKGWRYFRFSRPAAVATPHPLIHRVYTWEEAPAKAASLGKTIFLTTGSYNLELFVNSFYTKDCRLIVRVLPDYKVIKKVQDLGINQRDIIAMQGPFSRELNRAMFKACRASVVVTKDTGAAGGTDTKVAAALDLQIPVVVITRKPPRENEFYTPEELLEEIEKND
ncbi:MAG: precorrin-6A/cobalt-precorrin-6A reductase [Eubacteriales bacterium]|nr:precorrin-6A/cobalt-precorrin-6A reductase [Eubacteriales bacterium]MDN5363154.1 precorrin-6A/cobalt-precorrin-6A reductase [Eubacteriales bacterium]